MLEQITVEALKKKYDGAIEGLSAKDSMLIGISEKYNEVSIF